MVAQTTGRTPYFAFPGEPHRGILRTLERYKEEIGIDYVLDLYF